MISVTASRAASSSSVVPLLDQLTAQRGVQRVPHAVVMPLRDTVFAVVAAQLREERDGLLGALGDELAEQPRQRLGERRALRLHVGWEQVADRDVDGEPAGVEPADQFVGAQRGVDRVAQHAQRVTVVESHAARV